MGLLFVYRSTGPRRPLVHIVVFRVATGLGGEGSFIWNTMAGKRDGWSWIWWPLGPLGYMGHS